MENNLYKNNGDYNLYRCTITIGKNDKKTELDLSNIMQDIVLYESIYTPFMSGNITLSDNLNLLDFATLGYGEKINIEYSTAGIENKIIFEGLVYSVSEPYRATEHTSLYTLHFASHPFLYAKRLKHWNAYKNNTLADIVKTLFDKTYEMVDSEIRKELSVTMTSGNRYILFTGHDTIEAFQMCSRYAASNDDLFGFVFYENSKEFRFVPLEALFKAAPTMEYFISQRGAYTGTDSETTHDAVKSGFEESFNQYQDLTFEKNKTLLESIVDGSLGTTYNFVSLRDKVNSKITTDSGKFNDNVLSENQYLSNYVTLDNEGLIIVKPQIQLFGDEQNIVKNETVLNRCNNIAINIATFGNSELKVGDIVKANIPRWSTGMGESDSVDRYTGNYLVAEIKHIMTRNAYNTRLKIIRDGINGPPIEVEDRSRTYNDAPNQALLEEGANENIEKEEQQIATDKKYSITATGRMQGNRGAFGIMSILEDQKPIFTISFRSGSSAGNGIFSIWNGNFLCNHYRNRRPGSGDYNKSMTIGNVGFSFDLDPVNKAGVNRGDLRIHPDGGKTIGNGSAGCLAVNGSQSELLKCENLLRNIIKQQKNIPVFVNISGNPNNKTRRAGNE